MNSAETILLENIDKPNSCFVFPTDIAASRWADHALRLHSEASGAASCTVAMNKFIAWDVFKQNSIKSKVQGKKSIPSALRKIFVNQTVMENACLCEQGKTPLFTSLIRVQWACEALQFTSWLTEVLPQLGLWFKKTTGFTIDNILKNSAAQHTAFKNEGDDRDMYVLAKRYAQFLERHGLFEPAWETPPFNNEGKECFIFFPESLSDFSEYRELLETSGHVKIINADTEEKTGDVFFYTNSRREITEAALYIRALHEKKNIDWDSIAVCFADSQNYEPYVIREFTNRNIPFVKRVSKSLADYHAGRFFRSVIDCTSQDFSFSSLVSLIMNRNLPWKDTARINKLIRFGMENNCLCSWTEEKEGEKRHINVWEDAFKKPLGVFDSETKKYFENLKRRLHSLRNASSFFELRRQYFIFREQFLDMENCSESTDLVLSRCISELMDLIELEKNFPNALVPKSTDDAADSIQIESFKIDHFKFFTEYLSEVYYLARQKTNGVAILPYKTAASAPFDCHIILGSGQENLSVVHSRLDFLPRKKREELGIFDEDASFAFINLHKSNSSKTHAFFCSEHTFSGFAIPHTKIGSLPEPKDCYAQEMEDKFSRDYFNAEREFCASPDIGSSGITEKSAMEKLHEIQKNGFTQWRNRRRTQAGGNDKRNSGKKIQELIGSIYEKNGKYSVSASSMQPYYQCSLKWLFERVFALKNEQIETSLMAENISGLVYHAVLNLFLSDFKNKNEILLPPVNTDHGPALPAEYRKLLEQNINTVFDSFPSLKTDEKPVMSALTRRLFRAGKKDFQYHLEKSLAYFLLYFAGCRVEESEKSYQAEHDSFFLRGIVDCILEAKTESKKSNYIIVDFKTKYLPDLADCTGEGENGLSNFQLPMYITLTEENQKYKVCTALFYSILDSQAEVLFGMVQDINTKKMIPKKEEDRIIRNSEKYNKIFMEFNKKAEQFSQEISTGNFTVFETNSSKCYKCDYHRICRTAYTVSREDLNKTGKLL
ncbi:MAG: PD-(D/E)XK nuclease family protein [Treponema sp.]|jgi:hypothetical protein|nr:PD-(D/E)XK nuclease family protein [Treponema sp.]